MESLRAVGGGGLHALHAILLSFPIAFFAGGVTSDIAYLVRRRGAGLGIAVAAGRPAGF